MIRLLTLVFALATVAANVQPAMAQAAPDSAQQQQPAAEGQPGAPAGGQPAAQPASVPEAPQRRRDDSGEVLVEIETPVKDD